MKPRIVFLLFVLLLFTLSCQALGAGQQPTRPPLAQATTIVLAKPTPLSPTKQPDGSLSTGNLYETDAFSFQLPDGWKTYEQVWGRPNPGQEYYGLGVKTVAYTQYPPQPGKGNAFFAVATSPLAGGESLEDRCNQAYADPVPAMDDILRQPYQLGDLSGFEISYQRPWGEGRWRFRDIWLEKDAVVYVLSFHSTPVAFDSYAKIVEQILASFVFK